MYIKVLQRNIEPKEKSRQTKLAKKKKRKKEAKRKENNNINSGDRKDKISTSRQSLSLSRLLLLLDSQVYISVIIKQDQCYLIDRRSGGPLPWVPEVFSRVCRGASFRRPQADTCSAKGRRHARRSGEKKLKGLFTWSGEPRSSGVGFFCFHALGDTKQKKPTPLDRGLPLHVNRV